MSLRHHAALPPCLGKQWWQQDSVTYGTSHVGASTGEVSQPRGTLQRWPARNAWLAQKSFPGHPCCVRVGFAAVQCCCSLRPGSGPLSIPLRLSQFIVISSLLDQPPLTLFDYQYPEWSLAVGYLIGASSFICVPFYMVYKLVWTPGSLKQVRSGVGDMAAPAWAGFGLGPPLRSARNQGQIVDTSSASVLTRQPKRAQRSVNGLIILSGISEVGPGGSRAAPAWAWRQEATPSVTPPPVGHLLPAVVCCRLTRPRPRSERDAAGHGVGMPGQRALLVARCGKGTRCLFSSPLTACSASPSASGRRRQPERPEQSCACHPSCSPAARPGDAGNASAPCSCPDEALGQAEETLPSPSSPPPALRVSPGCWWQLPG